MGLTKEIADNAKELEKAEADLKEIETLIAVRQRIGSGPMLDPAR